MDDHFLDDVEFCERCIMDDRLIAKKACELFVAAGIPEAKMMELARELQSKSLKLLRSYYPEAMQSERIVKLLSS